MDNLNFYIPESQTIPTDLRLQGDGVHIYYDKLPEDFGYVFKVYHPGADEVPDAAADRALVENIAHKMCAQSYDHGASWRIRRIQLMHTAEFFCDCNIFHVLFRVRDAW